MATKERKKKEEIEDEARQRQGHLNGMEPPSIPEIEDLAEKFVKARNAWQRRHQPMMEAQELLHDAMKRHNLRHYQFDDYLVDVVGSEKVKVKAQRDEDEE